MSTTDLYIRSAVAEDLVLEGYAVKPARNHLEALRLVGRTSVHVIVLDLMMPVWTAGRLWFA